MTMAYGKTHTITTSVITQNQGNPRTATPSAKGTHFLESFKVIVDNKDNKVK